MFFFMLFTLLDCSHSLTVHTPWLFTLLDCSHSLTVHTPWLFTLLDAHRVDTLNIQGTHIRSYLNLAHQVNYKAQKDREALYFVTRVLKKGNRNTKSLAYTSLVRRISAACWDPCREGKKHALHQVQKETAQFTNHTKYSEWETLAQRRTIARLCAHFKAYCGERA
jgi:hypothetical protein